MLQRIANANRAASEAATEVARGVFSRASEAVQSAGRTATNGDGRQAASEPAPSPAALSSESEANPES